MYKKNLFWLRTLRPIFSGLGFLLHVVFKGSRQLEVLTGYHFPWENECILKIWQRASIKNFFLKWRRVLCVKYTEITRIKKSFRGLNITLITSLPVLLNLRYQSSHYSSGNTLTLCPFLCLIWMQSVLYCNHQFEITKWLFFHPGSEHA